VFVKNEDGSVKPIYRRAENITHAEQIGEELKREFENRGQAFIDGRKIKIEGMRTWEQAYPDLGSEICVGTG
jgi:hypothetical protein